MAKTFKLADETGLKLTEVINGLIENIQLDYDLSRPQARKLLAECLVRNCVYEEIAGEANWLLGIDREEDVQL